MAYATVAEMSRLRPGGIATEDQDRALALLEEASLLVEEATNKTWVYPVLPPKAVKSVVIQCALRVFENPDCLSAEQLGSDNYQRPAEFVTGLELSDDERKRVRLACRLYGFGSPRIPLGYDATSLGGTTAIGVYGDPL